MNKYCGTCIIFGGKSKIVDEFCEDYFDALIYDLDKINFTNENIKIKNANGDIYEMYTNKEVNDMIIDGLHKLNFSCKNIKIKHIYSDLQYCVECIVEYPHEIIFNGHSQDFYMNGIKTFEFEDTTICSCEFTINKKLKT
jgi:hypothetical protein